MLQFMLTIICVVDVNQGRADIGEASLQLAVLHMTD